MGKRLVLLMLLSILICNCSVGPQDPSVMTLVEHFRKVITEITDDKWSHLPSKWISKKDKQKLYVMDRKQLQDERVLDSDPQPFFLAYHRLGEKLYLLREKVVVAFRKTDYEHLTPIVTKCLWINGFYRD
jgi:hypothetical protein